MLRKIVIGLAGALVLILISAVVLLAFLGSGKESALKKAETFCQAARGLDWAALEKLAASQQPPLKVDRSKAVQPFMFPGAVFEAARCEVTLENNKVVDAKVEYISR